MKKFHFKNTDEETCHERGYLLEFIKEGTYELREFQKSFTGHSSLIKSELIEIDDIETYLKNKGFEPCCWSPDINFK